MDASRVLFIGSRIPAEIAKVLPVFRQNEHRALVRTLLQIAVSHLQSKPLTGEQFQAQRPEGISAEQFAELFAGVLSLLTFAVRSPSLKANVLKEDLKELKFTPECASDFVKVWESSREKIVSLQPSNQVSLPTLERMRWRVDVAISTSFLSRVLKPTILFQMTLSDGRIRIFEVPLALFHELRYSVALMLKDTESIKQKNIFKIKD